MSKTMRSVLIIAFVVIGASAFSQQDTILYFVTNGEIIDNIENAKVYREFKKIKENKYLLTTYRKSIEKWEEDKIEQITRLQNGRYKISDKTKRSEKSKKIKTITIREVKDTNNSHLIIDYYPNNEIKQVGFSELAFPLSKFNTWLCSHENGELKSKEIYSNNQLIGNRRWDTHGNEQIANVFWDADTMPIYGEDELEFGRAISYNLMYPKEAAEDGKKGRVYIQFIIMEDGRMEELKVVREVHPLLDAEAIRAV